MNPKSLINATRATIAKTQKIIQDSKGSQKLSHFTDPKVAERLYHLLFGPPVGIRRLEIAAGQKLFSKEVARLRDDFFPSPATHRSFSSCESERPRGRGGETRWYKVLNPAYSQKVGRADFFQAGKRREA